MRILVVEDDESIAGSLCDLFLSWGFECETATSIEDGMRKLINFIPHIMVLDLLLKGKIGTELIDAARKQKNPPCLVLCSAMHGADKIVEKYKPDYFLKKPFNLENIEEIIMKKVV